MSAIKCFISPLASTAYCLAYFTYVDRYVDIPYYFKYFKYAKRIVQTYVMNLNSTVVCHDTADGSKYKNKAYLLAILQYILSI